MAVVSAAYDGGRINAFRRGVSHLLVVVPVPNLVQLSRLALDLLLSSLRGELVVPRNGFVAPRLENTSQPLDGEQYLVPAGEEDQDPSAGQLLVDLDGLRSEERSDEVRIK